MFYLLWCCLGLCAPAGVAAQEMAKPFNASAVSPLAAPLQWLAVPKGAVVNPTDFNDAAKAHGFADLTPAATLPTARERDVWLRFSLAATPDPQTWYLRIPQLRLELATLYFLDSQGRWMTLSAGDNVAASRWPVPARAPSFPLATRTDRTQTYYLKLEHRRAVTEQPVLVSVNEYIEITARVGGQLGIMLGLFSLLILLSLLTAWLYRNMHFVWFALLVFMLLIAQLVLMGFANQRLWPQSMYLNKIMTVVIPFWTLAASTWFVLQVSYAKEAFARIHTLSLGLIGLLVVTSIAYASMQSYFSSDVINGLAALALLWTLAIVVWMALHNQAWLWLVAAGFAPLTLSMLARAAYNLGWIARFDIAQLWSLVTGIVGMIMLYTGLIMRNRETFAAIERASGQALTDPTTNLSAAHIALMRLPRVLDRSARSKEPCGVIMLRWLDYEKHLVPLSLEARGAMLSHLGARLRQQARHIDTVARLDDDHFMYLLESPISRDAVNALGTKILVACMRTVASIKSGDTFNVHIAIWTPTQTSMPADAVIEALRTRLDHMGHGTTRKVQFVDVPTSTQPTDWHTDAADQQRSQAVLVKIKALEADPFPPHQKLHIP